MAGGRTWDEARVLRISALAVAVLGGTAVVLMGTAERCAGEPPSCVLSPARLPAFRAWVAFGSTAFVVVLLLGAAMVEPAPRSPAQRTRGWTALLAVSLVVVGIWTGILLKVPACPAGHHPNRGTGTICWPDQPPRPGLGVPIPSSADPAPRALSALAGVALGASVWLTGRRRADG